MKIIIVGCGRVGASLAAMLATEGHVVSIIDKNSNSFSRLPKNFQGDKIEGIGFDRKVLEQAKIEQADAFASVTSGDNTNIISALVAKKKYRVPIVVTRIYDPSRAEIYRRLGLVTISSTTWGATTLKDLMLHPGIVEKVILGSGEVKLIEVKVLPALAGKKVADLEIPSELSISGLLRNGKAVVPTHGTILIDEDILYLSILSSAIPKLKKMLGRE